VARNYSTRISVALSFSFSLLFSSTHLASLQLFLSFSFLHIGARTRAATHTTLFPRSVSPRAAAFSSLASLSLSRPSTETRARLSPSRSPIRSFLSFLCSERPSSPTPRPAAIGPRSICTFIYTGAPAPQAPIREAGARSALARCGYHDPTTAVVVARTMSGPRDGPRDGPRVGARAGARGDAGRRAVRSNGSRTAAKSQGPRLARVWRAHTYVGALAYAGCAEEIERCGAVGRGARGGEGRGRQPSPEIAAAVLV
jgi:hypothetical protein